MIKMSSISLAIILLAHLPQVLSGTVSVIGEKNINGEVKKSVTMKWRATCDVGEYISQYSIYLPGNKKLPDVDGTVNELKYNNATDGILKDRLQFLYFPANESNYKLGGDFHLTLKDLKLDDKHNFTLDVPFSKLQNDASISTRHIVSWIAIQSVRGGPFRCDRKAILSIEEVPTEILVEEDTAASVIFKKDICVRGYPKPFIKYKFTGSEFITANSDVKTLPPRDQEYRFSKFTTKKLVSSDCGKKMEFLFAGHHTSTEFGGPLIVMKFTKPVVHSMHKQTTNGKTSFSWQVKDIGKCVISEYTATVKRSDGTEVNYSIDSRKKTFTLPSENIRKLRIKSLFTTSKALDDSNYWYDVDNPVDPVSPEESSSSDNLLIGIAVAISIILILVITLIIFWITKGRKRTDNTPNVNTAENHSLHSAQPVANEYVQMPLKSKPEKQANIVYDVVGVGGGRVPGSAPAQASNHTPQQSHYSEVKTDPMGYPVTR